MVIKPTRGSDLIWKSYDMDGNIWFEANISLYDFSAVKTTDETKIPFIKKMLKNSVRLNSEFLDKWNGFKIENYLEFPLDWGLGSSSSLVYNIATWADISPFQLHFKISNGSGYDIACALADGPIKYISSDDELSYAPIDFKPSFADQLHFVHLGKKQDSAIAVEKYLKEVKNRKNIAKEIDAISQEMLTCKKFDHFTELLNTHEDVMSKALGEKKVKDVHFSDFDGTIKSLGAWGGDMVLVASQMDAAAVKKYFSNKGFSTVLGYDELVLG